MEGDPMGSGGMVVPYGVSGSPIGWGGPLWGGGLWGSPWGGYEGSSARSSSRAAPLSPPQQMSPLNAPLWGWGGWGSPIGWGVPYRVGGVLYGVGVFGGLHRVGYEGSTATRRRAAPPSPPPHPPQQIQSGLPYGVGGPLWGGGSPMGWGSTGGPRGVGYEGSTAMRRRADPPSPPHSR